VQWMVGGDLGTILTSADGITWNRSATNTAGNILSLAWFGGQWVAAGDLTNTISSLSEQLTSADGINWTLHTTSTNIVNNYATHIMVSNGSVLLSAGVTSGTNGASKTRVTSIFNTSSDGLTWQISAGNTIDVESVIWAGSQFVGWSYVYKYFNVPPFSNLIGERVLETSPDGVIWTPRFHGGPFLGSKSGLAWNGNLIVAVIHNQTGDSRIPTKGLILTSSDGISWTQRKVTTNYLHDVVWTGSQFVAVGGVQNLFVASADIWTSPDGIVWTQQLVAVNGKLESITWNGQLLVAVGNQIVSVTSTTGLVMTSPDGITWSHQTFTGSNDVKWVDGQFVASNTFSSISSIDGFSWFAQPGNYTVVITPRLSASYSERALSALRRNYAWSEYIIVDSASGSSVRAAKVDITPPLVTALIDLYVEATASVTLFDLGTALATDTYAGGLVATPDQSGYLNIGSYAINWSATDNAGNIGSALQKVVVQDTTPPILTLNGLADEYVELGIGAWGDQGAVWTDAVDGAGTIYSADTVDVNAVGLYAVNYASYADAAGNVSSPVVRRVHVQDTVAPVFDFSPLVDVYQEANAKFSSMNLALPSVSDVSSVVMSNDAPVLFPIGLTVLNWTATDSYGNVTSTSQNIFVQDTTAPTLALNGPNFLTIALGATYTDAGTTVTDNVDVGLTAIVTGSVNTNAVGSYMLTFDVTDSAGNAAVQVVRTVNVTDQAVPVISLNGLPSIATPQGMTYTDAGATVTDNVDVGLTATVSGYVDTNAVGTYTLTFDVSDSAGNAAAQVARTVNVTDQTVPVIYLNGLSSITTPQGMAYTDAGATVADNVDVGLAATVSGSVNINVVGTYTLTFDVTDGAGNAAGQVTRVVNVTDQTAPVISLNGVSSITISQGTTYIDAGTTVTDNVDVGLTAIVTGSVNTNAVGTYMLTFDVTDGAGNAAGQVTRVVNVIAPPTAPTDSGDSSVVATGGGKADSGGSGGGCLLPANQGQSWPMLFLLLTGMALIRRFGVGN